MTSGIAEACLDTEDRRVPGQRDVRPNKRMRFGLFGSAQVPALENETGRLSIQAKDGLNGLVRWFSSSSCVHRLAQSRLLVERRLWKRVNYRYLQGQSRCQVVVAYPYAGRASAPDGHKVTPLPTESTSSTDRASPLQRSRRILMQFRDRRTAGKPLAHDGCKNPASVAECPEIALTGPANRLETCHFPNVHVCLRNADVEQCLDLKTVTPVRFNARVVRSRKTERINTLPSKSVVAVAQIGISSTEQGVCDAVEE